MSISRVLATLVIAATLGACATQPVAETKANPRAPAEGAVPSGDKASVGQEVADAHLFVFLGQIQGLVFTHRNWREADFYINGTKVGAVGPNNCLSLNLRPGVYLFSWRTRNGLLGPVHSGDGADTLQPGQNAYFALNIGRNAGAVLGPIGWWADPDRGHIVDEFPHALPNRCKDHPASVHVADIKPIAGPTTNLPPSW